MGGSNNETGGKKKIVSVHWFRHGLRLHDNPAMLESLRNADEFYAIFIFDGEVAGTAKAGYPRMNFLVECLQDLDANLRKFGTRLFVLYGQPEKVFHSLFQEWGVNRVTFEQDPEPVWQERDAKVRAICNSAGVQYVEMVSHTLWEPQLIISANGGSPPLTYEMFCQVKKMVDQPPRPCPPPDFSGIKLPDPKTPNAKFHVPTCEELGVYPESEQQKNPLSGYKGGESRALELLTMRIQKEQQAFKQGRYMPNQSNPDLTGLPMSLSPHLRFGTLSVRRFYWAIRQAYMEVNNCEEVPDSVTGQLIWREYFYCMSVNNPKYNVMKDNPICLDIDWYYNQEQLDRWARGQTGYPWIDACMRQLRDEGWVHHVCRQSVACFLTRGDLWIDWELGLAMFDKYLLDADWSVNAGNWMWVSSSAFEKVLQCPRCICPVYYGRRMDPTGDYVRRYVPEVKNLPLLYQFEPWNAPKDVQEKAGCVVGRDYPAPMVDHKQASKMCRDKMEKIKNKCRDIPHIAPSNAEEVRTFIWMDSKDMEESTTQCQQHGFHRAMKATMGP